jgi:hypothetical protein
MVTFSCCWMVSVCTFFNGWIVFFFKELSFGLADNQCAANLDLFQASFEVLMG